MRVFVVGTGRCGTVTFARACRHIANYTSSHESRAGRYDPGRLDFPDRHIEVDPHLAWMLGALVERHPDAWFVHLQRERAEVVASWERRGFRADRGPAPLLDVVCQTACRRLKPPQYREALGFLYDLVVANIRAVLPPDRSQHVRLHEAKAGFAEFWDRIGAEGDREAALAVFDRRWNASPGRRPRIDGAERCST